MRVHWIFRHLRLNIKIKISICALNTDDQEEFVLHETLVREACKNTNSATM